MYFSRSTITLLVLSLTSSTLALPAELETRQAVTTENGLSAACKAVTLIYARGTNEAGNVGGNPGPQWFTQLRAASTLGTARLTVQGVTYVANVAGYQAGGSAAGTTEMVRLINLASTKCPTTRIVLGGYSQGAQLVHKAAARLTAAVTAKIAAVVVFGDPNYGTAVGAVPSSKVRSFCHAQDVICTKSGGYTTHLNYNIDAATASAFVVARV